MKEATKEWLGIKPADFVLYAGFAFVVPAYYSTSFIVDSIFLLAGLLLCIASCNMGMRPHQQLGKFNNAIKLIAYPACTLLYLYLAYLNYTIWK